MKDQRAPIVKDLVLVGGGHSHVIVLRRFGMNPIPGVRITLIARDIHTPYSGMLPGLVAGHYTFDETHIDLAPLATFAGARLFHDEAVGIDFAARRVICKDRPPVPWDALSLDTGSTPRRSTVPGADEHAVAVKPISTFVARWEALRARVLASDRRLRIGVVGAGAAGTEITLAAQHTLRGLLAERGHGREALVPEFALFSSSSEVLPTHNPRVRRRVRRVLDERGVTVVTGHRVARVEPGRVILDDERTFDCDEILWVTDAGGAPWIAASGMTVDDRGFILVDECLRSISHPEVFAAGDVATMVDHPREKAGVFAVRQGPPLEANLRRVLLGETPRPFRPQRRFLSLISTGDRYAIASRGRWSIAGRWVWRWKDRIDRRFMRRFSELAMPYERETIPWPPGLAPNEARRELSTIAMRCGGCGAKVGSTVLSRVLASIADGRETAPRDDIVIGLDAPDDAAVTRVPEGRLVVHTVDAFRAIVDDPWIFGQIAANHALGDIWAMGAEASTALAIATVPFGLEAKVEATLEAMLRGALLVLDDAGAALIGGHTSEGLELSLGFALTGLVSPDRILRKGGLAPGDALILTKPLGTGTLFAAHMRLAASGRWIDGAIASMLRSNRTAAAILHRHGARGTTDVTGFGLLGHLVEMTKAAGVDARVSLGAVPLLDGAAETAGRGFLSSLQASNVRLRRAIRDLASAGRLSLYPLLFDPQTAGGLLAGVPTDRAADCVRELRAAGDAHAAIIGEVRSRSDAPEPIIIEA